MVPIALVVVLVIAVVALGFGVSSLVRSCTSDAQSSTAATEGQAADSATEEASDQALVPDADGKVTISLGFIGDITFADDEDGSMAYLNSIGSTDITDGIDARFVQKMNDMDLMWANNEFVYSERGEPLPGKMFTFRSPTSNVKYLHDLGVDIAGLANNHTYDYGLDSFLDTLTTLEDAGIPYVGAGRDDTQAYAPVYLKVGNITIGYVAASRAEYEIFTPEATADSPGIAWCYDNERILESIREADANADFVVMLPHWGVERSTELESEQIEFAHQYIDAGADIVIGAHPHILQGAEFYEGKPILYSIGNFWFDGYDTETAMVEVQLTGTLSADGTFEGEPEVKTIFHPGYQSGMYTAWVEGTDDAQGIFDLISYISVNAHVSEDGTLLADA